MKRKSAVIALSVASLLALGCLSASAGFRHPDGGDSPTVLPGSPDSHPVLRLAKALKLSEEQQRQIRSIVSAEHEAMRPQAERLFETRRQLRQAGESTVYDESSVRSLAAEAGAAEAEIIVSRIRVQNRINSLLSPPQLELLAAMKPEPPERMPLTPHERP